MSASLGETVSISPRKIQTRGNKKNQSDKTNQWKSSPYPNLISLSYDCYSLVFFLSAWDQEKPLTIFDRDIVAMAASLQSAATFLLSTKISAAPSRGSAHLRSTQTVGKSFGLESSSARLTCSYQSDIKDFAGKCSDAVKIAGFALATSALVVSVTNFLSSPVHR